VGASTTSDAGGAMSFAETQPPEGEHLTGAQVGGMGASGAAMLHWCCNAAVLASQGCAPEK
jgi:hypothetical protein